MRFAMKFVRMLTGKPGIGTLLADSKFSSTPTAHHDTMIRIFSKPFWKASSPLEIIILKKRTRMYISKKNKYTPKTALKFPPQAIKPRPYIATSCYKAKDISTM